MVKDKLKPIQNVAFYLDSGNIQAGFNHFLRLPDRRAKRFLVPLADDAGRDREQVASPLLKCLTAWGIPFRSPNILSTVYDVTVPEVCSTALSIQCLIEYGGAATAPAMAGVITASYNMPTSILVIGTAA